MVEVVKIRNNLLYYLFTKENKSKNNWLKFIIYF
jgi:hypothetical protein